MRESRTASGLAVVSGAAAATWVKCEGGAGGIVAVTIAPVPAAEADVDAAVTPIAEGPMDVVAAKTEPETGPDISDTRLSECARRRA